MERRVQSTLEEILTIKIFLSHLLILSSVVQEQTTSSLMIFCLSKLMRLGPRRRTHRLFSLIMYTVIFSFIGIVLLYGVTDFAQNIFVKP